jgi:hypothetical protein
VVGGWMAEWSPTTPQNYYSSNHKGEYVNKVNKEQRG